ncbi:hypothetical protein MHBO_001021 [Bonamia ostreae]|uniref:F-box domain-containing protein n=1 Tax=Bonamia ostreae TaxID=126728 RepID=A0ABV2AHL1_9EUKA
MLNFVLNLDFFDDTEIPKLVIKNVFDLQKCNLAQISKTSRAIFKTLVQKIDKNKSIFKFIEEKAKFYGTVFAENLLNKQKLIEFDDFAQSIHFSDHKKQLKTLKLSLKSCFSDCQSYFIDYQNNCFDENQKFSQRNLANKSKNYISNLTNLLIWSNENSILLQNLLNFDNFDISVVFAFLHCHQSIFSQNTNAQKEKHFNLRTLTRILEQNRIISDIVVAKTFLRFDDHFKIFHQNLGKPIFFAVFKNFANLAQSKIRQNLVEKCRSDILLISRRFVEVENSAPKILGDLQNDTNRLKILVNVVNACFCTIDGANKDIEYVESGNKDIELVTEKLFETIFKQLKSVFDIDLMAEKLIVLANLLKINFNDQKFIFSRENYIVSKSFKIFSFPQKRRALACLELSDILAKNRTLFVSIMNENGIKEMLKDWVEVEFEYLQKLKIADFLWFEENFEFLRYCFGLLKFLCGFDDFKQNENGFLVNF